MEIQRIEAEVKRRFQERQRRKEQELARLKKENEVRQKVAAAAFARSYLSAMQRNVFSQLHQSGHFYDPLRREIEESVVPMALDEVNIVIFCYGVSFLGYSNNLIGYEFFPTLL